MLATAPLSDDGATTSDSSSSSSSPPSPVQSPPPPTRWIRVNGVLCQQLPLRELPTPEQTSLDKRRKRNREAMRRARGRQQLVVDNLKTVVATLESELRVLQVQHGLTGPDANAELLDALCRAMVVCQEKRTVRHWIAAEAERLQDENAWLQDQLRWHCDISDTVRRIVREQLTPPLEVLDLDGYTLIEHALLSKYQMLSPLQVFELVQESHDAIVKYAAVADSCRASSQTVLGWSDKRAIMDGAWASFMVSKDFAGERTSELAERTWEASTNFTRYQYVQRWAQRMKILQALNEETLVVARENVFPDNRRFHTFYLLFRVPTEDGFIIGTRSLNLNELGGVDEDMVAEQERTKKVIHVRTSFIFKRIMEVDPRNGSVVEVGCTVKLGGRIGNGDVRYAHAILADVLPTILRWENLCVKPLITLTP
ncbi:hypothetical protein PINS_up006653 [Pythium insidiosum]|nr:hypothetical protein PINS_up006653 [Pythium insidiosum]